jgi:hypothetical protein
MINKDMTVFQNYAGIEKILPGPCGETFMTSHDAKLAMNIKAEEMSDAEELEDPLAITSPRTKTDPKAEEVSVAEEVEDLLAVISPRIKAEHNAEEDLDAEEEDDPLEITSLRIKAEPKAEKVSDAEEEGDFLTVTFPRIKAEPKAEDVSNAEEEDDPLAITSPGITAEPEVSFLSLYHSSLLAAIRRALPEMSLDNCNLLNVACRITLPFSFNLFTAELLMLWTWLNMAFLLHLYHYGCHVYKHVIFETKFLNAFKLGTQIQ